jgi:hypothetical protein
MGEAVPENARYYKGTFCTGHVPMVGTTSIQFSENAMHEYIEEYKKAHNMQEKKGPGRAKVYDFRAQPKRESPNLPIAGCALGRMYTGAFPERRAKTSSQAVGDWWNDPVLNDPSITDTSKPLDGRHGPPACLRISTNSDYGQYFHDPLITLDDERMAKLRAQNGCKRVLPVEQNSSFALDDLPTADRML